MARRQDKKLRAQHARTPVGRPCSSRHGAHDPARAQPTPATGARGPSARARVRPTSRRPQNLREASRRIGKARDTSRGAHGAPQRARARKAPEGPRARPTPPDASRRLQTRPCACCPAHARSRQPQKPLERPRQCQNALECAGSSREGPGTCWMMLERAGTL